MNDPNHMLQSIWMAPGELDQHLEVGDLVEISRPAASSSVTYSHWGVYYGIEDGIKYIAHFSTEHGDFGDSTPKIELRSKLIHGSTAHVRLDPYVQVIGESIHARINNSLDHMYNPFPPVIIKDRILRKMGSSGYNLIFNNCEQFSKWIRYGRHESDQSSAFSAVATTTVTFFATWSPGIAIGAGFGIYYSIRIGRRILHRYLPSGIV